MHTVSARPTALGEFTVIIPTPTGWSVAFLDKRLRWTSSTHCNTRDEAVARVKWARKWHKLLSIHYAKKLRGKAREADYELAYKQLQRYEARIGKKST